MHNLQIIETPKKKRLKMVKGYVRYKTTSQNVSSGVQVKFFFGEKVMYRSQDFQVFVFLTIP